MNAYYRTITKNTIINVTFSINTEYGVIIMLVIFRIFKIDLKNLRFYKI